METAGITGSNFTETLAQLLSPVATMSKAQVSTMTGLRTPAFRQVARAASTEDALKDASVRTVPENVGLP